MAQSDLKDRAHELSSFANNAFSILSNDLERAEYLIKLRTKKCHEAGCQCTPQDCEIIHDDTELMERVFELRFTIAESEDRAELKEIHKALLRDYQVEIASLARNFISEQAEREGAEREETVGSGKGAHDGEDEARVRERRTLINRARYLFKMIEEVKERLHLLKMESGSYKVAGGSKGGLEEGEVR